MSAMTTFDASAIEAAIDAALANGVKTRMRAVALAFTDAGYNRATIVGDPELLDAFTAYNGAPMPEGGSFSANVSAARRDLDPDAPKTVNTRSGNVRTTVRSAADEAKARVEALEAKRDAIDANTPVVPEWDDAAKQEAVDSEDARLREAIDALRIERDALNADPTAFLDSHRAKQLRDLDAYRTSTESRRAALVTAIGEWTEVYAVRAAMEGNAAPLASLVGCEPTDTAALGMALAERIAAAMKTPDEPTEHEATEPEATEPEATEPEATEPEATRKRGKRA